MNIIIQSILPWLQLILLIIIGLSVAYLFIFAVAGLFYRQPRYSANQPFRRIAVLIPGYKEDQVIIEVAQEALKQDYPHFSYDVIVIADSFRAETLGKLKEMPLKLIEVSFDKSTKAKALNKAMAQLGDDYEIAVILDADNIMAPDFLTRINAAFEKDIIAVQGHRAAKNLDTSLAILDAISEEINNHIFRKGHRALGLSSAIIGSGMAFRYDFFKNIMSSVTAIGGFDKEIELKMLKDGYKVEYLHDAVVLDEKVQQAEVFSNQRRRWLSAQYHYFLKDFFASIFELIRHGNIDYFDKSFQFLQLPRILLLGAVYVFSILFISLNIWLNLANWLNIVWIVTLVLCTLALLFAVPKSYYNRETLKALITLPGGMFLMFRSLLRIKGANKQFIHTQHGAVKTVKNSR